MNDLTVQRFCAKISNGDQKPNFFPVNEIINQLKAIRTIKI